MRDQIIGRVKSLMHVGDRSDLSSADEALLGDIATAIVDMVAGEVEALQAENARLRSLPTSWQDRADDLTPEIEANNPLHHRDFKTWERAMFLVGNRYSKGALVALVAYLLSRAAITDPAAALTSKISLDGPPTPFEEGDTFVITDPAAPSPDQGSATETDER